ncbi:MAG: hypothetical protein COA99_10875 [Moraxellaceae bacterium]|nr:MAG: hypothetical protein COA99_10875 [Moraxellaceae bacterium]
MTKVTDLFQSNAERQTPASMVGRLVELREDGVALVDYPGNTLGPLVAQSIITLAPSQAVKNQSLMLMFDNQQADKPVIMGVVQSQLVSNEKQTMTLQNGRPDAALVDGKTIHIDAKDEIQLICGKSSVILRKDGKIVIKGTNILSRSSGANKIKGASINLN